MLFQSPYEVKFLVHLYTDFELNVLWLLNLRDV
jgi:hypothetical protein